MKDGRMKQAAVAFVAVAVVVVLVAGGVWLWASMVYEDSLTHSYEYELNMEANGTLQNATLYVPVPVENGESEIGDLFVERDVYEDTDAEDASPWEYSLVPTERGLMLEIRAEQIEGRERIILREFDDDGRLTRVREVDEDEIPDDMTNFDVVRHPTRYTRIAGVESDGSIDTRSPLGNEPMLSPKDNVSEVDCSAVRHEVPFITGERCYVYASYVYADYEASPDTHVSLSARLEGSNSWWIGGWNSNWYSDHVRSTLVGEHDGWTAAEGAYSEEAGSYR